MGSGIYKINNLVCVGCYIGSAVNIEKRWSNHISDLNRNSHTNVHLQHAYNKYGKDNFEFSVIEYVDNKEDLIELEQFHIDGHDFNELYNFCRTAGSRLGLEHTVKSKKKMSESLRGRKHTKKTKKKLSEKASKYITFKGKTQNIKSWAKELGVASNTLTWRLKRWGIEKALTTHKLNRSCFMAGNKHGDKLLSFNGKTQNISTWANELGISNNTMSYRLKNWPIEKALTTKNLRIPLP